jgi:hypothetical protein
MIFQEMGNNCINLHCDEGSEATIMEMTPLPENYVLAENDILCGRGKKCFRHIGNENFRKLVQANLRSYAAAPTKTEKTLIIREVIKRVQDSSPNGGFVKHDPLTGRYYEVGDTMAVSTHCSITLLYKMIYTSRHIFY